MSGAPADGTRAILDFWFEEVGPERWWADRSAELDAAIRERFGALWEDWRGRTADHFLATADTALAAVILFDQFSRNMFRGEARAFATDGLALEIASAAIDRGYNRTMSEGERSFLYMPFMHAEDLAAQERSVALFTDLGWPEPLKFARLHRDVIARHGRFPGRNAALGREIRPEEDTTIAESHGW